MTERTLALVKTSALRRGQHNSIIAHARSAGFRLLTCEQVGPDLADAFFALYAAHREKPFFPRLIASVLPGSLALVLERENAVETWRALMGPTVPDEARQSAPHSLRALYGRVMPDNAVHGSDSVAAAIREIGLFFSEYAPATRDAA